MVTPSSSTTTPRRRQRTARSTRGMRLRREARSRRSPGPAPRCRSTSRHRTRRRRAPTAERQADVPPPVAVAHGHGCCSPIVAHGRSDDEHADHDRRGKRAVRRSRPGSPGPGRMRLGRSGSRRLGMRGVVHDRNGASSRSRIRGHRGTLTLWTSYHPLVVEWSTASTNVVYDVPPSPDRRSLDRHVSDDRDATPVPGLAGCRSAPRRGRPRARSREADEQSDDRGDEHGDAAVSPCRG